MPFDGQIVTMRMKYKIGIYLNKGDALAIIERNNIVKAEIEIPEAYIAHVHPESNVRLRPLVYHRENLQGVITSIDQKITERNNSRVFRVTSIVENRNGTL